MLLLLHLLIFWFFFFSFSILFTLRLWLDVYCYYYCYCMFLLHFWIFSRVRLAIILPWEAQCQSRQDILTSRAHFIKKKISVLYIYNRLQNNQHFSHNSKPLTERTGKFFYLYIQTDATHTLSTLSNIGTPTSSIGLWEQEGFELCFE